jgi:serine/threonine-protein kinase
MEGLLRVGSVLAGRYRIDGVIGSGGMGVVTAASDLGSGRDVAIKLMSPKACGRPELRHRFFREARISAALRSRHLVRVYEVSSAEAAVPYIVMERLEGRDAHALLDDEERLAPARSVDIVLQSIEALSHAHGAGIVHRDLKPSNLFLSGSAERPLVKVLDFGVAKVAFGIGGVRDEQSSAGTLIGTLQYMAPEQMISPQEVDPRADVWSLGVILYELITGERPFEGNTLGRLAGKVRYQEPVAPTRWCPEIPIELERVVMRCLRKERAQRYAGVDDLARALRPFAAQRAGALLARRCYRLPPASERSVRAAAVAGIVNG